MTRNRVRPGQPFSFSASLYNELLTKTQEIQRERPQVIPERYIHVRAFNRSTDTIYNQPPFQICKIHPTDSLTVAQSNADVVSRLFTSRIVAIDGTVGAEPGEPFGVPQEPIPVQGVGEIVVSGSAWLIVEFDEETQNAKWADVNGDFGKAQKEKGPIRIELKTAVEFSTNFFFCFVTLSPTGDEPPSPSSCNCGEYENPPEYEIIDVLSGQPFIDDGFLYFPQKKLCVLACSNDPTSIQLELESCAPSASSKVPVQTTPVSLIQPLMDKIKALESRIQELEK